MTSTHWEWCGDIAINQDQFFYSILEETQNILWSLEGLQE